MTTPDPVEAIRATLPVMPAPKWHHFCTKCGTSGTLLSEPEHLGSPGSAKPNVFSMECPNPKCGYMCYLEKDERLTPEEVQARETIAIRAALEYAERHVRETPFGILAAKNADDWFALNRECAALKEKLAALEWRGQGEPTDEQLNEIAKRHSKLMIAPEVQDALTTLQQMWDYCDDITRNGRTFGATPGLMRRWSKALAVMETLAATPQPAAAPSILQLYAMAAMDGYVYGDRDMPSLQRWRDYWDAAQNPSSVLSAEEIAEITQQAVKPQPAAALVLALTCKHSNRSDCALFDIPQQDKTPAWVKLSDEIEASPPQGSAAAPVALTDAEALAREFHETYERFAPAYGYVTRPETRTFDPESTNGKLMIAVCTAISAKLAAKAGELK